MFYYLFSSSQIRIILLISVGFLELIQWVFKWRWQITKLIEVYWKWQPTPVFLPGESHGQRSLVGYSPWGCKESDTTERLHLPSPQTSLYLSPTACSNSHPLSRWCHPTILSSVIPLSYCLQYIESESFPTSWLFVSGSHSIGVSASASIPPMKILDWFPLDLTGLISLQSKSLSSLL